MNIRTHLEFADVKVTFGLTLQLLNLLKQRLHLGVGFLDCIMDRYLDQTLELRNQDNSVLDNSLTHTHTRTRVTRRPDFVWFSSPLSGPLFHVLLFALFCPPSQFTTRVGFQLPKIKSSELHSAFCKLCRIHKYISSRGKGALECPPPRPSSFLPFVLLFGPKCPPFQGNASSHPNTHTHVGKQTLSYLPPIWRISSQLNRVQVLVQSNSRSS